MMNTMNQYDQSVHGEKACWSGWTGANGRMSLDSRLSTYLGNKHETDMKTGFCVALNAWHRHIKPSFQAVAEPGSRLQFGLISFTRHGVVCPTSPNSPARPTIVYSISLPFFLFY